nr:hypothetical protein [Dysgonomonas sp. HGC4]
MHTIKAFLILIAFDARGLCFLVGCNLSSSTSFHSLIIYIELAINEKPINAYSAFINASRFKKLKEKNIGAKTKRFLTHW